MIFLFLTEWFVKGKYVFLTKSYLTYSTNLSSSLNVRSLWSSLYGRVAQLARVSGLHPEGYRFKSDFAHLKTEVS